MTGCNGCGKTSGELRDKATREAGGIVEHREPVLAYVSAPVDGWFCRDCRGRAIRAKWTF